MKEKKVKGQEHFDNNSSGSEGSFCVTASVWNSNAMCSHGGFCVGPLAVWRPVFVSKVPRLTPAQVESPTDMLFCLS